MHDSVAWDDMILWSPFTNEIFPDVSVSPSKNPQVGPDPLTVDEIQIDLFLRAQIRFQMSIHKVGLAFPVLMRL